MKDVLKADKMKKPECATDGEELKSCAINRALLQQAVETLDKAVGSIGEKTDSLKICVVKMNGAIEAGMKELKSAIAVEVAKLQVKTGQAVERHEDRFHTPKALENHSFRGSATKEEVAEIRKQGLITRNRMIYAIATLIITISGMLAGTQFPSCSETVRTTVVHTEKGSESWHSTAASKTTPAE